MYDPTTFRASIKNDDDAKLIQDYKDLRDKKYNIGTPDSAEQKKYSNELSDMIKALEAEITGRIVSVFLAYDGTKDYLYTEFIDDDHPDGGFGLVYKPDKEEIIRMLNKGPISISDLIYYGRKRRPSIPENDSYYLTGRPSSIPTITNQKLYDERCITYKGK